MSSKAALTLFFTSVMRFQHFRDHSTSLGKTPAWALKKTLSSDRMVVSPFGSA